jgi:Leucine-rich repeat (LRR) protein
VRKRGGLCRKHVAMTTDKHLLLLYAVLALCAHVHSCEDTGNGTSPCPSPCFCYWSTGCVRCDARSLTQVPHTHLRSSALKEFRVANTLIQVLAREDFQNYELLERIMFSSNKIQTIADDTFSDLQNLFELDLSNNHIVDIRAQFSNLQSLQTLNLDTNGIGTLAMSSFTNLPNLKTLLLSNNNLTRIDGTCFINLTSLSSIELINNQLDAVPVSALQGLAHLKTLILDKNSIRVLHANLFKSFPTLKYLSLKENYINSIDPDAFVGNLQRTLFSLSLTGNKLDRIPTDALSKLGALHELHLAENNLIAEMGDNSFRGLTRLSTLDMSDIQALSAISVHAFAGLRHLSKIDLNTSEQLTTIHKDLFVNCSHLTTVCLKGTSVETIPEDLLNWNQNPDVDFRSKALR